MGWGGCWWILWQSWPVGRFGAGLGLWAGTIFTLFTFFLLSVEWYGLVSFGVGYWGNFGTSCTHPYFHFLSVEIPICVTDWFGLGWGLGDIFWWLCDYGILLGWLMGWRGCWWIIWHFWPFGSFGARVGLWDGTTCTLCTSFLMSVEGLWLMRFGVGHGRVTVTLCTHFTSFLSGVSPFCVTDWIGFGWGGGVISTGVWIGFMLMLMGCIMVWGGCVRKGWLVIPFFEILSRYSVIYILRVASHLLFLIGLNHMDLGSPLAPVWFSAYLDWGIGILYGLEFSPSLGVIRIARSLDFLMHFPLLLFFFFLANQGIRTQTCVYMYIEPFFSFRVGSCQGGGWVVVCFALAWYGAHYLAYDDQKQLWAC
jgi:hypothetical protein